MFVNSQRRRSIEYYFFILKNLKIYVNSYFRNNILINFSFELLENSCDLNLKVYKLSTAVQIGQFQRIRLKISYTFL